MIDDLDFQELDRDGALREAGDRLPRSSRRAFVRAALAGGAGAALALTAPSRAAAATKNDVAILNYALALEYLQSSFYTEAERRRALEGEARTAARVLGSVERAHVEALRKVLGRQAGKRPFFNFQGVTEKQDAFLRTAVAFEDLGTAAYKGQAHLIDSPAVLAAAISIHSVEARHAAWIRFLAGVTPASDALDEPKSKPQTLELVKATRFVVSRPRTQTRAEPRYTG
jgi:Ferritin-like domain